MEQYEIIDKTANRIMDRLEKMIESQEIQSRQELYSGFVGGILGCSSGVTDERFNNLLKSLPFSRF